MGMRLAQNGCLATGSFLLFLDLRLVLSLECPCRAPRLLSLRAQGDPLGDPGVTTPIRSPSALLTSQGAWLWKPQDVAPGGPIY